MSILIFLLLEVVCSLVHSYPYINLNTKDSWFTLEQKKIAWTTYDTGSCSLPLTSTLSLIDCEDGQVLSIDSVTSDTNFTISSNNFQNPHYYYTLSVRDSTFSECGQLSYYVRIPPAVATETHMVKGNDVCINLADISFAGLLAFWPDYIGSPKNCYCGIFSGSNIGVTFSDCYCIKRHLTDYTVEFNSNTSYLCWKNLSFEMNGTMIGIARQGVCNQDWQQLLTRTFVKSMVIIVEDTNDPVSTVDFENAVTVTTSLATAEEKSSPSIQVSYMNEFSKQNSLSSVEIFITSWEKPNILPNSAILAGVPAITIIIAIIVCIIGSVWICTKKKKKSCLIPKSDIEHEYELPRFSSVLSNDEPVYEDITDIVNENTMASITMENNGAYALRRNKSPISLKKNQAYEVPSIAISGRS